MNIILIVIGTVLGIVLSWFVFMNLVIGAAMLGYVLQERAPYKEPLFRRLENFWKKFWRKSLDKLSQKE